MPVSLDPRVNFIASLFGLDEPPAKKPARPKSKPKVTTREEEIRNIARKNIREREQSFFNRNILSRLTDQEDLDRSNARLVNFSRGLLFALPEIGDAAIRSLTEDRPFRDQLAIVRAEGDELVSRGKPIDALAALPSAFLTGGAVTGGLRAGGAALGGRVGKAISDFTRLERGRRATNVGKLTVGGAAGGAAQAAGEGSDIGEGAIIGGVAGPALPALGKVAARIISLPANAIGGSSAVRGVLRRITNTSSEELEKRAIQRRVDTGAEPTVFELLDASDQKRLLEDVIGPNADVGEEARGLIAARLQEIGDIGGARVAEITRPGVQQAEQTIAGRIGSARGGEAAGDVAVAARTVRSPVALEQLRSTESGLILEPFDKQIAVGSVDDLVPKVPVNNKGRITEQPDPEIAAVVRSVSGTARLRKDGGITIEEITKMRRKLKKLAARDDDINSGPAAAALENIDAVVAARLPAAAAAIRRSDEAFAGASRIAEGAQVGAGTVVRDAPGTIGTSDTQAQLARNVFTTPEGATGRLIGQTNRLLETFAGGPVAATKLARELTTDRNVQKAVSDNLGAQAGGDITRAAQSLDDGVRSLARALPRAEGAGAGGADDLDVLVDAITISNPAAFPTAKAWAARRIINATVLPEKMARDITEMLFSRDPVQTRRALNLLNSSMEDAATFRRDLGLALAIGETAVSVSGAPEEGASAPADAVEESQDFDEQDFSQMSDEELLQLAQEQQSAPEQDFSQLSDEELLQLAQEQQSAPFGRSIIESVFPGAEVTDDIRDPNSPLGQANPGSFHVQSDAAVDVRPIPGLTFDQFVQRLRDEGHIILEARDEVTNPSLHATGPHWHVVFG